MLHSSWFWIAFAILVFWALGAYNRLVRLRAQIKQQFGPLQAVLMEYQEVVQQAVTAAAAAPQLGQPEQFRLGSQPLDPVASGYWAVHHGLGSHAVPCLGPRQCASLA